MSLKPKFQFVKITVPITDYYPDQIFKQDLFFDHSPTKEEVIQHLKGISNRDSQFPSYYECLADILESINLIQFGDWKTVSCPSFDGAIIGTNCFIDHPKFGRQSISWDVINVY